MTEEELNHLRKVVKLTFIRIGIRCDLVGFSYLCHAVELVVQDPSLLKSLCKGLYTEIGNNFKVKNTSSVERDIRHAIEDTYISKSFSELNRMFETTLYTVNDKPTVGELIRLVAEYYLLELYK